MNPAETEIRPWYREPWPWVLIALALAAVIASMVTLWLALSNPDYLVVDEGQYRTIEQEMRAQAPSGLKAAEGARDRDGDDGER
jgi:hypothetical protein